MSTKSKSVHGHSFSSLTRGTQVDEKTSSPSPSTPVGNRQRSSRQPRLSFSAFAPSSENDDRKKETKPEAPVTGEEEEEEEEEKRTWNLRPRKKEEVKNQKSSAVEPKSNRQRGIAAESPGLGGGGGVEVGLGGGENHRLWIALSRDEIEEDLFSMSGNRASRRPRKRTKTLQKYIDVISPGLCLVGMNADCFKLSISPAKR